MSGNRWMIILFITLLGAVFSQSAQAFRCSGGLVSEGDAKISVVHKCGPPDWSDRWIEEHIELPDTDLEYRLVRLNERWFYNPGPTQFVRILTFRDGRVATIRQGGRGFIVSPGITRCDFDRLALGTSSAEVATRCGPPDLAERRHETITMPIPGGRSRTTVAIDEWTFNLGATRFLRILTFRNGELIGIRTGEKGFP